MKVEENMKSFSLVCNPSPEHSKVVVTAGKGSSTRTTLVRTHMVEIFGATATVDEEATVEEDPHMEEFQ
jgi:hypothetical protein